VGLVPAAPGGIGCDAASSRPALPSSGSFVTSRGSGWVCRSRSAADPSILLDARPLPQHCANFTISLLRGRLDPEHLRPAGPTARWLCRRPGRTRSAGGIAARNGPARGGASRGCGRRAVTTAWPRPRRVPGTGPDTSAWPHAPQTASPGCAPSA